MMIKTIEPTPSPNTMKVIVNTQLPFGENYTYTKDNMDSSVELIQYLLNIPGVKSVFHVADFLAVEREGSFNWKSILSELNHYSKDGFLLKDVQEETHTIFGVVNVQVQEYKRIPLQVKVTSGDDVYRIGLSENFIKAFNSIQLPNDENYLSQRIWKDYGVRYGDNLEQIATQVKDEIEATITKEKLQQLVSSIQNKIPSKPLERTEVTVNEFAVQDWKERFRLLSTVTVPSVSDLPLLKVALNDEKMAIRRLAVVYCGMIEDDGAFDLIKFAMNDKVAAVRRTAGDCMSDIGDLTFEKTMQLALLDKSAIVRWRAAMYLYEVGTEHSIMALEAAKDDEAFEVQLQVRMALARIKDGEEAKGSVWKQMMESRKA